MPTFRRSLVALALAALPATAQLATGTVAPTIVFADTLHAPPGMRELADLRGAAILVEFWATWCGPCKAQIPHMRSLHDNYAARGLVVVSVTEEEIGTVQPFAEQQTMNWPIGIAKGAAAAWQVKGIPHAFLIGPDGTIAWTGHPGALEDKTIEPLLANAVSPLQPLTEQLAPVQDLLDRDQRGRALAMLELLERGGKLAEPSRTRAAVVSGALRRQLESLAAGAKATEEPFARALLLQQLVEEWQGQAEAAPAAIALTEINQTNAADVAAASATRKARRHFAHKELDEAVAAWNAVIATASAAATKVAKLGLAAIDARRKSLGGQDR